MPSAVVPVSVPNSPFRYPVDAAVLAAAFHNRLDRTPNAGDITITVVCNDAAMDAERVDVDDIYGDRAGLPFDITIRKDLTTAELESILTEPTDFLHYVGHVDAAGFVCMDGALDAADPDTVGVDAFLLNACHSYDQGMALIRRGAIGGIVTLNDLLNHGAVRMGRTLARLLNCGFPLRSALEIARGESIVGSQYLVVGDGGLAIAQSESGIPNLCAIERVDDDAFKVEFRTYPTSELGMGGHVSPYINSADKHYLTSGRAGLFEVSRDELNEFLELEDIPMKVGGKLLWSDQVDLTDF